jgi:tRNA/rRNA methyltransferase
MNHLEIVWVLIGTKSPENLGAAARAIKTMGFAHLRLVNPCEFSEGPARWMAMHSHDILDNAAVFPSLRTALLDCDLCVGTSAKLRHQRHTMLTPPELAQNLTRKTEHLSRVALIFGPEDTGLSNADLAACDLLTSIPLAHPQPSLNLAQAIMVYTYVLSSLEPLARTSTANQALSYRTALEKIDAGCNAYGIDQDPRIMRWLHERVPLLAGRDLRMLFNLIDKLRKFPNQQ